MTVTMLFFLSLTPSHSKLHATVPLDRSNFFKAAALNACSVDERDDT